MVIKYYYAVRIGRKPGIYHTWAKCREQVHKFSGAEFKKFTDEKEANEFVYGKNVDVPLTREIPSVKMGKFKAKIYIDGSFYNGRYGSGIVMISDEEGLETYSFSNNDKQAALMRNVAGEIAAARFAVELAITLEYNEIDLYYDYAGIECWATGEWKANKHHTKKYATFMQEKMKYIKINFHHVKAHSGNKYNEMADKLAKEAIGIKQ